MSDPLIRLFWRMKEWWEEGADEDAERAVCRAAAEISGLTPYSAGQSANFITGTTWMSEERDAAIGGLRRYAELAAEDE